MKDLNEQPNNQTTGPDDADLPAPPPMAINPLPVSAYQRPTLEQSVWRLYQELGHEAFIRISAPPDYIPEQAERMQQMLLHLASCFNQDGNAGDPVGNPLLGISRNALVTLEEDQCNYTEIERYAARRVKLVLDEAYLKRLSAYYQRTGDGRPLASGYLEYLDQITCAERAHYPEDERERVIAELGRQELAFGRLPEDFSLWSTIDWESDPDLPAMLAVQPLPADPAE